MKLYVLWIKRKENYDGEYAPEAVNCMDEYSFEENSDYLHDKKKEYDSYSDVERTSIVEIELNKDTMLKIEEHLAPVVKVKQ